MSLPSEALVAEVQQQQQKQESTFEADLSSARTTELPPTAVIPAIQFHRTLYLDGDGRPIPDNAPNNGGLRIHDVLSVPEDAAAAPCSLSSVLPLLSYHRMEEAFVCLNAQGVLRATTPTLEVLSRRRHQKNQSLAACLLVAHRGQLYGVQVDEGGVAKVVGTVRQVVSSWSPQGGEHKDLEDEDADEGQAESCLVLDGKVVGKVVRLGSVTFDPAHHVLVTVPLGGHCFAQLSKGTTAATADNDNEGEEGEHSTPLALLIGPAHILFTTTTTTTLKWNAYVDSSMKEMACKAVPPGSTFFQSSGGWWTAQTDPSVVEKEVDSMETPTTTTTYLMTGLGMRKCHFQEAFFYAQMHIGQTIKQKVIEEDKEDK